MSCRDWITALCLLSILNLLPEAEELIVITPSLGMNLALSPPGCGWLFWLNSRYKLDGWTLVVYVRNQMAVEQTSIGFASCLLLLYVLILPFP